MEKRFEGTRAECFREAARMEREQGIRTWTVRPVGNGLYELIA